MPTIRPFKGLRYNSDVAGNISDNVAPPYDIIYDEWRENLYKRSQYNIIRLIKSREEAGDTEENNKYTRAASDINSWMESGALSIDEKPAIYVRADTYSVNGESKTRFGFIALLKIEDFGNNVHPHERTLSAPKADRLKLVQTTETNLSQIFSVFSDPDGEIQDIILSVTGNDPDVSFVDEQEIHRRLWVVNDSDFIEKITDMMKDHDIVIADGHHRYETALNYKKMMDPDRKSDDEPFDYVSMYFSSADALGMTILPTHRKVSSVNSYSQKNFFRELSELFDVKFIEGADINDIFKLIAENSENNNCFGIYTCDGFGTATYKNPASPKDLDVDILHNVIIEKLLGISREDIALGKHVHFCKSSDHAVEDVASSTDQISFLMNAVTSEELFRTVLKGVRMPQKSTYFFPKTMSGLVMYKLDRKSID